MKHTNYWINRGRESFSKKDYTMAIKCFQKVIEKDPLHKLAHTYIGQSYMKLNNYSLAIEYFETSLSINMYDYSSYIDLAACFWMLRNYKEFEKVLIEILKIFGGFFI